MAMDWEDRGRYGRFGYGHDRSRGVRDRDWPERARDEDRSWFGEDAERRRMEDARRYESRGYGRGYGGGYADEDFAYGGYGGYADRGPGVGGAYAGYDRPWDYGGYGRPYGPDRPGHGATGPYRDTRGRNYGRSAYGRDEDRGFFERAGDEVSSWFGDEEAQRRREMDARHRGRGPKNYTRSDDRIHEDVNDRLSDDAHIDASDIEVSVSGGEVTLDGTVDERFAKRHAEDIAERVSGVKHVQNNLRIRERQADNGFTGMGASEDASRTTGSMASGSARH